MLPLIPTIILATLLFSVGIFLIMSKRNAIFILIGIELILNAANLNLIVFSQEHKQTSGQTFAIFTMVVAAAEVAVTLAILVQMYRYTNSADIS